MALYYLLLFIFLFIVCYTYLYVNTNARYIMGGYDKDQNHSNILIETIKEIKKKFNKKQKGNSIEVEIKILPADLNILWKLYQYTKYNYKPIYSNTSNLIKKLENRSSKITQYEYKNGKMVFVKNYIKQLIHYPVSLQIIPDIPGKFTFSNEKDIDANEINISYDLVRNKRRISFQISKNWRMDCTFIGYIHNDVDFFKREILSSDKLEIEFEYTNPKGSGICKVNDCNIDEVRDFLKKCN